MSAFAANLTIITDETCGADRARNVIGLET